MKSLLGRPLPFTAIGVVGLSLLTLVACGDSADTSPASGAEGSGGGAGANEGTGGGSDCVGTQCAEGSGGASSSTGGAGTGGSELTTEFECPEPSDGLGLPGDPLPVENAQAFFKMHINQVGYELYSGKTAVIQASAPLTQFQVLRASDQKVFFEGTLTESPEFIEWGGLTHHYVADFSGLQDEGTFVLRVNGESSDPFGVGQGQLFEKTASDVMSFFLNSRADAADTAIWSKDSAVSFYGGGGSDDVRGGWYDASGDLSKYLSHLNYANFMSPQQIPMTAWSLAWANDNARDLYDDAGLGSAVEEEALWGADYLVRVQNAAGFFYINVFDGWSGSAADRHICAFEGDTGAKTNEYEAGFREGAGMSIAALARISTWGKTGSFSPAEYLKAAEDGFAHLLINNTDYIDDGKENVIDDYTALMAASELYAATDKAEYLEHARLRAGNLKNRLSDAGYFIADDGERPFFHAAEAGLPVIALVRFSEIEEDQTEKDDALTTVRTHLNYLLSVTAQTSNPFGYARQHFRTGGQVKSGFFIPHDNETGYWWQGESARMASIAAAAVIGGRALTDEDCGLGIGPELATLASDQLDWIVGKNPLDISMLSGHGRNNPPTYCSVKSTYHGHHDGGISNGITGRGVDGSGMQWRDPGASGTDCWRDWRWVEQWLPHSTWYLLAVTAMAK